MLKDDKQIKLINNLELVVIAFLYAKFHFPASRGWFDSAYGWLLLSVRYWLFLIVPLLTSKIPLFSGEGIDGVGAACNCYRWLDALSVFNLTKAISKFTLSSPLKGYRSFSDKAYPPAAFARAKSPSLCAVETLSGMQAAIFSPVAFICR